MTRKISWITALLIAAPMALQAWTTIQKEDFTPAENGTLPATLGADWDAGLDVKVVPLASAQITSGTATIAAPRPGGDGYVLQIADVGGGGYNFAWPSAQTPKTANAVSAWAYLHFGADVTWEQDYGVFLSSAVDPTPLWGATIYDQLQGYWLLITKNSNWGSYYPPDQTAFLLKRVNEAGWIQVAEGKTAYSTGWHQMRLERDAEGRVQGFVDGKLEVSYTDSTPLPAGFPGMVFYNGCDDLNIVGVFDDFKWEEPSVKTCFSTPLWKIDSGDPLYAWFNGGDANRALALSATGNLIVLDRDATLGNKVRRLNATTGAEITPPLTDYPGGFVGGAHAISKAAVADDGAIYVCNLATTGVPNFRLYRYANEDSTPTLAYSENPVTARIGDCIRATGGGVNTKLLISGFGNPNVYFFTTVDGLNFNTKNTETVSTPTLASNYYVDYDVDGEDFWARKVEGVGFTTTGTLYSDAGAAFGGVRQLLGLNNSGAFAVNNLDGVPVMGIVAGAYNNGLTDVKALLYEAGASNAQSPLLYEFNGIEKTGGANANGNATGEFVLDTANRKAYVLYTNNSITAWDLDATPEPPSGIQDWVLYR